jgi:hypothetical protein
MAVLKELLLADTREAHNYREHIRAMSFAAVVAEIKLHMEIIHTVCGYTARFAIWSHCYIQTRPISLDMDNYIFSVLLKQKKTA